MNVYGRDRKGKGTKEGKTRRPQQGDCKIVFIPFACLSLAAGVTFHNHSILLLFMKDMKCRKLRIKQNNF